MYQFNEFWSELNADEIDEKFTSEENKLHHYDIHGAEFDGLDADEYEELADEIHRKPVDGINILGYKSLNNKSKRIAFCKYDVKRGIFVVYTYFDDGQPYTITCYKKTRQEYEEAKRKEMFDVIPKGK